MATIRLIVLLALSSVLWTEARSQNTLAEEWRRTYVVIFGRFHTHLAATRVLNHLTSLHSKINLLGEQDSVTGKMIDDVEYCFQAVRDTNAEHCNVEHMKNVRRRLKSIRYPLGDNLKTLFSLIHRNLVELCGALQMNVIEELDKALSDEVKCFLRVSMMMYKEDIENGRLNPSFRLRLFREIGVQEYDTEEDIMAAWARSPCRKLTSTLHRLNLQSFIEFVKLNYFNGVLAAEMCQPELGSYANIVHTCDRLELIVPQMARQATHHGNSSETARISWEPHSTGS